METLQRVHAHAPARKVGLGASLTSISVKGGWSAAVLRDMPAVPLAATSANAAMLPRANQPLRVEPPGDYNAPLRVQSHSSGVSGRDAADAALARLARRPLVGNPTASTKPERMRDHAMLASACRRAGRASTAGLHAFNQAVLFDNMGEANEALRCYKEVLRLALEGGDAAGEALACNALGVNLQSRVGGGGEAKERDPAGSDESLSEADGALLRDAILYHEQHLNVADVPGRFIAHCNLGLCHQALGQLTPAAENHEAALRYAIRMSSLAGESLACAHLGAVKQRADASTAKACTERRLLLARTLGDAKGKGDAYLQLGALAQEARDWAGAHAHFDRAMRVAQQTGDRASTDLARCSIGVVDGNLEFEALLAQAAAEEGHL